MSGIRKRLTGAVTALFFACLAVSQTALAEPETSPPPAAPIIEPASPAPANINLNLSSTEATGAAHTQVAPVDIVVGGATQTILPGQALTAAERVAVYQVMHSGTQNIIVGADGAAIGGSLTIGQNFGQRLSSLVVPTGVTVISAASTLNLAGDLTNAGSIFALPSNIATTTASITAANIFNQQGGLITSVIPTNNVLGLTSSVNNLNLSLTALNNFVNAGTITSAGNLNITAGGSITNALPAGITGAVPVMQAFNAVNINAANIVNSGLIAALTSNVNIIPPTAQLLSTQNFTMMNTGGTIQALLGSINIGNAISSTDIRLTDGNWLSQELNFNAGTAGAVIVDVDRISGMVNVTGLIANISNRVGDLNLASLNLYGDPIFTSAGNLVLANFNPGIQSDFIALAGGNITGTGVQINTSGGQIFLSAGYQFTGTNGNPCTTCVNGVDFTTNTNVIITPGASINLGTNSLLQSSGAVNGGQFTAQAPGSVTVGNIVTAGAGGAASGVNGGNGGSITAQSGGTLTTGALQTYGGGGGGANSNPAIAGGAGGTGGSVNIAAGSSTINILGDINTSGGGGGGGRSAPSSNGGAGGSAGAITILTTGAIVIAGPTLAAGGGGGSGGGGGGGSFGGGGGGGAGTDPLGIFNGGGGGGFFGGGGANAFGFIIHEGGAGGGFAGGGAGGSNANGNIAGSPGTSGNGGNAAFGATGGTFGSGGNGSGIARAGGAIGNSGGNAGAAGGAAGNGAAISISGSTVRIDSTIGSYYGFPASAFDAQSANALGTGGSITITTTGVGSAFVVGSNLAPAGSNGDLNAAAGVTINGTAAGTLVTTGTFQTQTVTPTAITTIAPTQTLTLTLTDPVTRQAIQPVFNFNENLSFGTTIVSTDKTPVNRDNSTFLDIDINSTRPSKLLQGEAIVERLRSSDENIALFFGSDFDGELLTALSNDGVSTGPGSGNYMLNLDRGRVFAAPKSDIVITTHEGDLHISKGAIAFVIETGHDVAIYDLHDNHQGGVKFVSNKRSITINPGQELVLTRNDKMSFAQVNPGFKVGCRDTTSADMGNGITVHLTDVPLISVIAEIYNALNPTQTQSNELNAVRSKMLKTAAVVQVLTSSHGAYKQEK